jgi:parallel beta-helix repeat protein
VGSYIVLTLEEEGEITRTVFAITIMVLIISMFTALGSVREARALETIYIRADGSIEPPAAPIQRNGDIFTLTNNIASDFDGIVIERNNTILNGAGHTIEGTKAPSSRGIYLSGNYNVTIKNIDIKTFETGILLDAYSTYNRISGNRLEGNDYGINCWAYADNNSIIGNNIVANNLAGVWIAGSSGTNITLNTIADNGQYGISLETSSNNTICQNDFINNVNQVYLYDSTGIWDNGYPSGGNYWSDYSGVDSNGDGIGDTPYPIDENNQDRYPLMTPARINIALFRITLSKNIVGQGYTSYTYVLVQNQGWNTETVNIILYANTTPITQEQVVLAGRSSVDVVLLWDCSGLSKGNYTISAYAEPVQGETDMTDNTCNGGSVKVTIPGDVTGDGTCDMQDISIMIDWFMTSPPNWNPNCDVNNDLTIDMADVSIAIDNFMVS